MPILPNIEHGRLLRAAAIGCGGHAYRNVFPAFQYAPVELTAFCDFNAERASKCARFFGATGVYTDYREMLEREAPEVVFVVLNVDQNGHPRYPSIVEDAVKAGAHVWIEKPPAANVAEVQRMIRASREANRTVGVGFKKMFAPANVKASQIIQRPDFGRVTSITARYPQNLPPFEERGNDIRMIGFLDHIVHPYSALRRLGGNIESLSFERCGHNGASITTIHFTSGAIGSLLLAQGQSGLSPLERTEIIGEGANVVVENNLRVTYYRPGDPPGTYGQTPSFYGDDESGPLRWEPEFSLGQLYNKGLFLLGYVPEIAAFCDAVLNETPLEYGNLGDALEIMRVYEAYRKEEGVRHRIRVE